MKERIQIGEQSVPVELLKDYVDSLHVVKLIPDGPMHDWHLARLEAIEEMLGGDKDEKEY